MATQPFPIPAFNFAVNIEGTDYSFSEVSGIKWTTEYKEVKSGGINNMIFKIPTRATPGEVTLKKGFFKGSGKSLDSSENGSSSVWEDILLNWDYDMPDPYWFRFQDIPIILKDETNTPVCEWNLISPILISWELSQLSAMNNELAFETLVLQPVAIKTKHY